MLLTILFYLFQLRGKNMPETLLTFLQSLVLPQNLHIPRGNYLFQPGDPASCMYGIKQGMIRMVRFDEAGNELVIYRAGTGETFAEAALFGDSYCCAVIAESDCRLLAFPKKAILAVMDEKPMLFRKYSALLSRQVRDLRSLLEVRAIRAADERLLHYIRLHADAGGRYQVCSSLMDLAGELGLAHETLYRNLKKLEDAGIIKRQGLEIFLL